MAKAKREPYLSSDLIAELLASHKREGGSFVVQPKFRRKRKVAETRIAMPKLPARGSLTKANQWKSLLWMIDMAQAHGAEALRGLTVALARMVQTDAFAVLFLDARSHRSPKGTIDDLLWDRRRPMTRAGQCLQDLLKPKRVRDRINLGTTAVITNIWEPWRLARAFQHLGPCGTWGAWKQEENHHAVAWHPWPLIWVDNGNHSTTAAMLKGGGELRCEASFDATPLLRVVTTDGHEWFGESRNILGPVRSIPMAGIIEIGRRLTQFKGSAVNQSSKQQRVGLERGRRSLSIR